MAPGVDVAARRNVAVAITDRTSETVRTGRAARRSRARSSVKKRQARSHDADERVVATACVMREK
jgi:hypothetical protein